MDIIAGLNTGKYRLGSLCKNKHSYNETEQSVRLVRGNGRLADCIFCNQERASLFYRQNKDHCLQQSRDRYSSDRENQRLLRKEWYQLYKQNETEEQRQKRLSRNREYHRQNKEKERQYARDWYSKNPEKAKAKHDRYRQSHPEQNRARARRNNSKRKARKKQAFTIYIEQSVFDAKLVFFENKCAYCSNELISGVNLSWDHVIPLAKGGTHTPNNLIPCCQKCNSSKCDSDIVIWFSSQKFFSKIKLKKIFDHIGKTHNNYTQLTFL